MFGIDDAIGAGLKLASDLIDRVIPDKGKQDEAKAELLKMQVSGEIQARADELGLLKAQIDVDKVEAANPNLFIAGGRPAFIWCGVGIFAFNYLVAPLATWGTALFGHPTPMPTLDFANILPIVMGLLGLGTMRTVEKLNSVVGQH